MEIIGTIIIICIVWGIIAGIIAGIIERHRQGIRDKAVHEVLDSAFNFASEKVEVLAVNKNLGFVDADEVCPSCGGFLVIRHGVYGPFLGCSNYPKCKFTPLEEATDFNPVRKSLSNGVKGRSSLTGFTKK